MSNKIIKEVIRLNSLKFHKSNGYNSANLFFGSKKNILEINDNDWKMYSNIGDFSYKEKIKFISSNYFENGFLILEDTIKQFKIVVVCFKGNMETSYYTNNGITRLSEELTNDERITVSYIVKFLTTKYGFNFNSILFFNNFETLSDIKISRTRSDSSGISKSSSKINMYKKYSTRLLKTTLNLVKDNYDILGDSKFKTQLLNTFNTNNIKFILSNKNIMDNIVKTNLDILNAVCGIIERVEDIEDMTNIDKITDKVGQIKVIIQNIKNAIVRQSSYLDGQKLNNTEGYFFDLVDNMPVKHIENFIEELEDFYKHRIFLNSTNFSTLYNIVKVKSYLQNDTSFRHKFENVDVFSIFKSLYTIVNTSQYSLYEYKIKHTINIINKYFKEV